MPINPQLCSDDMSTLKSAAIEGLGIVSLPSYTCHKELTEGLLVRVLPDWLSGKAELSLLMPSRKGQSPSVKALSHYLLDKLSKQIS